GSADGCQSPPPVPALPPWSSAGTIGSRSAEPSAPQPKSAPPESTEHTVATTEPRAQRSAIRFPFEHHRYSPTRAGESIDGESSVLANAGAIVQRAGPRSRSNVEPTARLRRYHRRPPRNESRTNGVAPRPNSIDTEGRISTD